jgi:hypothetical protein
VVTAASAIHEEDRHLDHRERGAIRAKLCEYVAVGIDDRCWGSLGCADNDDTVVHRPSAGGDLPMLGVAVLLVRPQDYICLFE